MSTSTPIQSTSSIFYLLLRLACCQTGHVRQQRQHHILQSWPHSRQQAFPLVEFRNESQSAPSQLYDDVSRYLPTSATPAFQTPRMVSSVSNPQEIAPH
ncbi:hypothetical protein BD289DRAFT_50287 [Coniella lustricola]|uniref:Secreted protein n=1 Tax=Coniella lustricola TaxID=2025994 RepID=A0A2T3A1B0_9PEZI|nr:hypothetical protein BD289DRAFT_50287 [Coniella lustricola]